MTDNKEEVKEEIKQEEKHEDCKCKENDKKCCHEHKKHNHDNSKLKEKEAEIEKLKKELEESVKKVQYASLTEVLRKFGVEEISRAGEVFDSNLEEALMTDNIDSVDDDIVTEVLLKGYKLKDRVIRPASVKINKKD